MTIEAKAKCYDELFVKAKQIYNKENDVLILHTIEDFFPELKESEDERIRKELAEFVNQYGDKFYGQIAKASTIAWLEKQGEKINTIENFDTEFEKQVSCLIVSAINKEHKYNQGYVKWAANALLNYAKHEIEKQGEQNLAWSEEDEKRLQSCLNVLQARGIMEVTETVNTKWLKSLKERVQPQPKQEWSEEDERQWNNIWDVLDGRFELSEKGYKNAANWFKSLKSQNKWKPSDEQMEVLLSEVKAWTKGCPKQKVLESLYNDLKKLREE